MIHGYGSTMDQPWINMDQRGSSVFSLSLQRHGSRVMRPDSWLMRHALSPFSVMAHGSCVMAHGSCVSRPMRHASDSWLMRPTHVACVESVQRHGSCVRLMAHASHASGSWLMRPMRQTHGSCVRLMAHAPGVRRPSFSPIQPPPVAGHDDNKAAAFTPCYCS